MITTIHPAVVIALVFLAVGWFVREVYVFAKGLNDGYNIRFTEDLKACITPEEAEAHRPRLDSGAGLKTSSVLSHSGACVQGGGRKFIHKGMTREEAIDRIVAAAASLGLTSFRIGGNMLDAGSYVNHYSEYGQDRYRFEPFFQGIFGPARTDDWNYNVLMIEAAAKGGQSVWLTFSCLTDRSEILYVIELCARLGVEIEGITIGNEPYLPKFWEKVVDGVRALDHLYTNIARRVAWVKEFYSGPVAIPMMELRNGQLSDDSRGRRLEYIWKEYGALLSIPDVWIDLHIYAPGEFAGDLDPQRSIKEYYKKSLEGTCAYYSHPQDRVVVTECALKDQVKYEPDVAALFARAIRSSSKAKKVKVYYQLLGSDADNHGLWNFTEMRPTPAGNEWLKI